MKNLWKCIPAAAILLTGCDAVIVEDYPSVPTNFHQGEFDRATSKGSIVTIVVGNPFSTLSSNFGGRVRALMKDQVGNLPVSFVSQHGAGTTKPYKVVVVFNLRRNVDNRTVCRMEKQTPRIAASPGKISVTMVFCFGENLKSGTRGRVGGVKDQSDPKFVSLVRQVANSMIPEPDDFDLQRDNAP